MNQRRTLPTSGTPRTVYSQEMYTLLALCSARLLMERGRGGSSWEHERDSPTRAVYAAYAEGGGIVLNHRDPRSRCGSCHVPALRVRPTDQSPSFVKPWLVSFSFHSGALSKAFSHSIFVCCAPPPPHHSTLVGFSWGFFLDGVYTEQRILQPRSLWYRRDKGCTQSRREVLKKGGGRERGPSGGLMERYSGACGVSFQGRGGRPTISLLPRLSHSL